MKKTALIISLLSIIGAYCFNELNLHWLKKDKIELRWGETVETADDASYLAPAESYLKHGEFKDNFPGKGAFFLRPPGYSLLFIVPGKFFGIRTALKIVKLLQVVAFGLSVYCLFFIACEYLNSKKWAIVITCVYGLTNIASCFLYYTLTEGITPALVVFYVFFILSAKRQKSPQKKTINYCIAALIFAFLFITRPVLGILGLAIPFFIFYDYNNNIRILLLRLIVITTIATTPILLWQIRNWKIANEFVGFHPIYYSENSTSCFRPTHKALWELCKAWGETGSRFHGYIVPFWDSAIKGDTSFTNREQLINSFPDYMVDYFGKQNLNRVFKNYQLSILYQKSYYDKNSAMPKEIPVIEQLTIKQLNELTNDFKHHFWFRYYIISPLKVFKEMAFHSNLSLYIFQKTFRGNFFMELSRGICFIIHSLAFCLIIFTVFSNKPVYLKILFSYSILIYISFLVFIQRGLEERYTLPILPLVLISSTQIIKQLTKRKNL